MQVETGGTGGTQKIEQWFCPQPMARDPFGSHITGFAFQNPAYRIFTIHISSKVPVMK